MVILKLGGSIITKKDSLSEVDLENIDRLALEIKKALDESLDNLIIIHGAGSFGHPPAKKYKIGEKFNLKEYPKKRIGFCEIQNEVQKLNTILCERFIKNSLPTVTIKPSSVLTMKNGRINDFNLDLIKRYINEGFIPVLYGDAIIDDDLKLAILSGDQIIQYLAKNLDINKVILGTDVDGVYNKNPKTHDDAILFNKVKSLEDLESFDSTTNVDVTGGMVGKIKELLDLASIGIDSKIINANKEDNLFNELVNSDVKGTIISKK